ncbi:MAG: hypothetical protein EXX96DRAFT_143206 [Benjaminiella poitrasii]|nr:MAG: hypothetical protein EXX96DRAFT_143206 [Benjaminiella poitrasii]
MLSATQHNNRKSHRVYRSPAKNDPDEISPYSKKSFNDAFVKKEDDKKTENDTMMIDAEDKEASTILMALAEHANRLRNSHQNQHLDTFNYEEENFEKKRDSMSIRNLLDNGASNHYKAHCSNLLALTGGVSKVSYFESKRKGYKICLTPRHSPTKTTHTKNTEKSSMKKLNAMISDNHGSKPKRNTMHIRISYRIHAHKCSLLLSRHQASNAALTPHSKHETYVTKQHSYTSAFRLINAPYNNQRQQQDA